MASAVAGASAVGVVLAAAAGWPGRPNASPPQPAARGGPPPAWIESTSESTWLAYGSYCWRSRCINYVAPALRAGLPALRVARGTAVRVHIGFVPRSTVVAYIQEGVAPRPLAAARVIRWRPSTDGRFEVEVRGPSGSASYVGSVRITGQR
jgi:hypothetical protein